MAILNFTEVGIGGIAACVPSRIVHNSDLVGIIGKEELDKVINNVGIFEKRHVTPGVTPSDLCCEAAKRLMEEMSIDKDEIDMVLFLSQYPDYKIPATSPSIQHRLGLSKMTACMDLSLACSGYVYSLSTAFAYASQPSIRNVLLLVGETFSQIVSPLDKVNAPLYGDAGTATLVRKQAGSRSQFILCSDGSGYPAIRIEAGGSRNPSSVESMQMTEREDGNYRSDHQVYMDGMEVFNFTLKVVPSSVKEALSNSGHTNDSIDFFVFHQANGFMIDFFRKKLKIESEKIPISLDKFGNVSSASIPLTIASKLKDKLISGRSNLLLSGFGAGLSWGTAVLETNHCIVTDLIEY